MKLTEVILKKLINEVLEEGMKTVADLPEGVFVKVDGDSNDLIEIYYSDADGNEWSEPLSKDNTSDPEYFNIRHDGTHFAGGGIGVDTEVQMSDEFPCLKAMQIALSGVEKGWGPLLYDVAIEIATLKGSGLVPDRTTVRRPAYDVWDKYEKMRTDVQAIQLDDEEDSFNNGKQDDCLQYSAHKWAKRKNTTWIETPLSKMYKKEPTTLRALRDSKRLILSNINLNF